MAQYRAFFAGYALREYERILALREVRALLPKSDIADKGNFVLVRSHDPQAADKLRHLAFFSEIEDETGRSTSTFQSIIESANNGRRRNIRYSMHSLHEYKGRFYPQLGKSLINYSGMPPNGIVLDPFCGCGTLLLESALRGMSAVGMDINPIGCMIADAKVTGLQMSPRTISKIMAFAESPIPPLRSIPIAGRLDMEYLSRWFPEHNLCQALAIDRAIQTTFSIKVQVFLRVALSALLTDFSYQNPKEPRIRRRQDVPPRNLLQVFRASVIAHMEKLQEMSRSGLRPKSIDISTHLCDSRNMSPIKDNAIDCVVTSPPYATAMPYIDANRLPLYFFGFAPKKKISQMEREMIGSREITTKRREFYERAVARGEGELPAEIMRLLQEIHNANTIAPAGFRRRNMAALLYLYFSSMQKTFQEIRRVLKPGGTAHFVVGNNSTIAGGTRIAIPTAQFLNLIARDAGFNVRDVLPMAVPGAYNIYSKNAIREEFISTMDKAA